MKKLIAVSVLLLISSLASAGSVSVIYKSSERVLSNTLTVQKDQLDIAIGRMYQQLDSYMASKNQFPVGVPYSRILQENLSTYVVQVGYPISASFPGTSFNSLRTGYLPSGRMLTTVHVGSYASIGLSYNDMENYMNAFGYFPVGEPWESYLDDPETVHASQLRTRIYWPVSRIAP